MSHYIHHVPGRLRLKTPALRRNESQARYVMRWLEGRIGIVSSEINTRTGSLIIRYEADTVSAQTIINDLKQEGYLDGNVSLPAAEIFVSGTTASHKIADTLVNKVVEAVVERSAVALIAAVL